jgi:hypothetical protein
MTRFIRNTVILVKTEVTPGVDPTPTGLANAMMVSNLTINPLNAQNVARGLVRGFMGGDEHLVGSSSAASRSSWSAAAPPGSRRPGARR